MRIEHISHFERFLELKSEWSLLRPGPEPGSGSGSESGSGSGSFSPALTHEWFSAWLQAFGKDIDLAILALFDQEKSAVSAEKLVGVAPMRIVRTTYRGIRCGQLRFLYNRHGPRCSFLMRNGYAHHTYALLEEALKLRGWDIAVLENIAHDSYLYELCTSVRDSLRHSTLLRRTMSSPFLKIAGSWEDFFNTRPRNLRRSLRSKERKLSAEGGMRIEHFTDATSSVSIMPTLVALGEKSWKARGGRAIGSQPESRRFYSLLAETFGKQGQVSVWLMKVNDKPAAFEFHLTKDKEVQALRAEFDEKYRSLGVGSILDKEIVKTLFESEYREYDMGGESDFYKLRWTEDVRQHSELLVFSNSALGKLLCTVEKGVVEPIKRVVKPRKS